MKLLAIVISLTCCGSAIGQVSIPIVDADFESAVITNGRPITDPAGCGTAQNFDKIIGWTFVHLKPGSGGGVAHWICDDGAPNSNVAFLSAGEGMYQLLTEKARMGTYVLEFDVANWFYPYPGDWKAELFQGQMVNGNLQLSPAPFCSASGWALGDMVRHTVPCNMSGYFLQANSPDPLSVGGQNPGGYVVIYFTSGVPNPALGGHAGWPILIDNVTLTFTPTN